MIQLFLNNYSSSSKLDKFQKNKSIFQLIDVYGLNIYDVKFNTWIY